MKFNSKDTDPHLFYRMESEDGKVEIGVYPTIYGFRVRAGIVGNGIYELDYCCGANITEIETVYSIVLSILSAREIPVGLSKIELASKAFENFPIQEVKPMHNDPDCLFTLNMMVVDLPLISVKTPDVHKKKSEYLKNQL